MGVNLIAIFPYNQFNEKIDELILKVEKQDSRTQNKQIFKKNNFLVFSGK